MREAVPRGLCLTHALAHTHTRAPGSVRQFASAHSHTHTHTHTHVMVFVLYWGCIVTDFICSIF